MIPRDHNETNTCRFGLLDGSSRFGPNGISKANGSDESQIHLGIPQRGWGPLQGTLSEGDNARSADRERLDLCQDLAARTCVQRGYFAFGRHQSFTAGD
jgi:hypothetical protein